MLGANAAAARFFRRELLRATGGWPTEYLKESGIEHVLSTESTWKVGYAPDTWTNLVDHLKWQGFSYATMVRAGLMRWTADGDAIDRYRDELVLVARDHQMASAGFIGIGPEGIARSLTPATAVHRPSNVLVGIEEQIDLLRGGAMPVIVDHPVDAITVSQMSRRLDGQWAAIPVCGETLSTAQVRMLRKFSMTDTVAVMVSGDERSQKRAVGYIPDLMLHYDRVRAVALSGSAREFTSLDDGPERLHELLTTAPPTMSYRIGSRAAAQISPDPEPPDRGLDL
jgi:DNA primase